MLSGTKTCSQSTGHDLVNFEVFIRFCRILYKLQKYAKKKNYFIGTFSQVFGSLIIFCPVLYYFELHYYVKKMFHLQCSPILYIMSNLYYCHINEVFQQFVKQIINFNYLLHGVLCQSVTFSFREIA